VLDTEIEEGQDKRADNIKVIALALLLSSLFIYNSKGDIDESAS
jgi:hypothetical protein